MVQLVHPVSQTTNDAVEVVVHVKETLADEQQRQVVSRLKMTDGIVAAEFCPLRNHLVLARYDRNRLSSQDVIRSFHSLRLDARLIGPI